MMRFVEAVEPGPKRTRCRDFTIAVSFIESGLVPLSGYFFFASVHSALIGSVVTLLALPVFGYINGQFTTIRLFRSAWQVVVVGG